MRKVELLAPAGNMQSLKAAICAGADAIYLAGTNFGARAYAANFNDDEIKEAIDLAHLYDVKIYVTINTLIKDNEIHAVLTYINYIYELGVDAIIIQDLGLYTLIKANFSDLEIHASTQMHIHNKEGLEIIKKLGFQRAVIARETPINKIRELYDNELELEVFVHGALCVSYSGLCLFSSLKNNRSGNRGECAQHCRMKYSLYDNDIQINNKEHEYLLSTKDLFTLDNIKELLDAKVSSLKIEGRMKRSEYVYYVVHLYRKYIDAYYANKDMSVLEEEIVELKKLYNRDFTGGFLFNNDSGNLINNYRANHQGIVIGKVSRVFTDKVEISLSDVLRQNDGIRVLNSKCDQGCIVNMLEVDGLLVNTAYNNDSVIIHNTLDVKVNDVVVKTTDSYQINKLNNCINDNIRKIKIKAKFVAKENCVMKLILTYNQMTVCVESEDKILVANKVATDKIRVMEQLNKIKDTCYLYDIIELDMDDNLFIPIKSLNELRRKAVIELNEQRIHSYRRKSKKLKLSVDSNYFSIDNDDEFIVFVSNADQYNAAKEYNGIKLLTYDYDLYLAHDDVNFMNCRVMNDSYSSHVGIGEIGGLTSSKSSLSDSSLNVYNAYTLNFYSNYINDIILSLELNYSEVKTLISNYNELFGICKNAAIQIYGRIELMTCKFCILKNSNSNSCLNCKNKLYTIKDINNNSYMIKSDTNCLNHIYDSVITNKIDEIDNYKELGIKCFVFKFTNENYHEVKKVLKKAIKGY